LILLT